MRKMNHRFLNGKDQKKIEKGLKEEGGDYLGWRGP